MRFKSLPTTPHALQLLAIETDRYLDHWNQEFRAGKKHHDHFNMGPPPPDVFGDDPEAMNRAWNVAASWAISNIEEIREIRRLADEASRASPATPTLWEYVDWPFRWDLSEGGGSLAAPPSWLVAFEDWHARLEGFVDQGLISAREPYFRLVEELHREIRNAIDVSHSPKEAVMATEKVVSKNIDVFTKSNIRVIQDITKAVSIFRDTFHYPGSPFRYHEQLCLDGFTGVADSVRPIRSLIDDLHKLAIDELLLLEEISPIQTELLKLVKGFDGISDRWSWQALTEPAASREAYIEARRAEDARKFELPIIEAALSWYKIQGLKSPDEIKSLARKGVKRQISPALDDFEEIVSRYHELVRQRNSTPLFGCSNLFLPHPGERNVPEYETFFDFQDAYSRIHGIVEEFKTKPIARVLQDDESSHLDSEIAVGNQNPRGEETPTPENDEGFERISASVTEPANLKPIWDSESRTLQFYNRLSSFRSDAVNVIAILDLFQGSNWAREIRRPFGNDEEKLKETIKYFNKKKYMNIEFVQTNCNVAWERV